MADRRVNVKLTLNNKDYLAGVAQAAAAMEALEDKVVTGTKRVELARNAEAMALSRVTAATQRLAKLDANDKTTTEQRERATLALARAQIQHEEKVKLTERATRRLEKATLDLESGQRRLAAAQELAFKRGTAEIEKQRQATEDLGDEAKSTTSEMEKLEQVVDRIAKGGSGGRRPPAPPFGAWAAAAAGGGGDRSSGGKSASLSPEEHGKSIGERIAAQMRLTLLRNSPVIAAAVAGALTAGAPLVLAGAAVLFGGIAGVAGAQATVVREAWRNLGDEISRGSVEDARVVIPALVEMADDLGDSFERLRPQLRAAFEATGPLIERMTAGLTGFVEHAMPGLVTALEQSKPVMDGFTTFMERFGDGFGEMFERMAAHAPAAGRAFAMWGDLFAELLPLLGELLAQGSELAGVVLPPLTFALARLTDIVGALGPLFPTVIAGMVGLKVAKSVAGGVATLAQSLAFMSYGSGATATAAGKASTAIAAFGRALPIAALSMAAFEATTGKNEGRIAEWTETLVRGGKGAADLKQKVLEAEGNVDSFGSKLQSYFLLADLWDDDWAGNVIEDYDAAVEGSKPWLEAREEEERLAREVKLATDEANRALIDVPGVATSAGTAIAFVGESAGKTEEQFQAAVDKVVAWREEIQGIATAFVDPLNTYQMLLQAKNEEERLSAKATADMTVSSTDSWTDYAETTKVTLDELATELENQIEAHKQWNQNIVTITARGGEEVAQILLKMGEEGIQIAADMANGTDAEFNRMAAALIEDARLGGRGAAAELDAAMKIMAIVGKRGADTTASQIAAALDIGADQVAAIAKKYGINLAQGLNPLLGALGKPGINISQYGFNSGGGRAEGGYIAGPGGPTEDRAGLFALSNGEYVLRAASVAKYGRQFLDDLNVGRLATGGYVTTDSVPRPPSTAPYRIPISTAGDSTMEKKYNETVAWVRANMQPIIEPGSVGGSANGLLPIMAMARAYVMARYGISNIGGYSYRNIAGTSTLSDHALGKAIDIMTTNYSLGWQIARDFAHGPAGRAYRAENVIWQQSISSRGGPFVRMADRGSPTQNHMDHVHVDTYDRGGVLRPGLTLAYNGTGKNEYVTKEFTGGGGRVQGPAIDYARLAAAIAANARSVTIHTSDNPQAVVRALVAEQKQQNALAPRW